MAHLKRHAAPKFWHIERKRKKFTISPKPGPHSKRECIPLGVVIRDVLKYAHTLREAKQILNKGLVKVNNIKRKQHSFPVGLMDNISLGNEFFVVMPSKKGMHLQKTDKAGVKSKFAKIMNKKCIKGKVQLNLHNGDNMQVDKDEYTTFDVLVLESKKITEVLKFKKGAKVLIIKGINKGKEGVIKELIVTRSSHPNQVIVVVDSSEITLPYNSVFVVG